MSYSSYVNTQAQDSTAGPTQGFWSLLRWVRRRIALQASSVAHRIDRCPSRAKNYDMRFDLLDYETTVGHLNSTMTLVAYLMLKSMLDVTLPGTGEQQPQSPGNLVAVGRLAATRHLQMYPLILLARSFDKAIYVSIPIDWIASSPNRTKRRLILRPITRDGGAQLSSARRLYRRLKISNMPVLKSLEGSEMNKFFISLTFILILASCSNAPDTETGEMRTLQLLKRLWKVRTNPSVLWTLET